MLGPSPVGGDLRPCLAIADGSRLKLGGRVSSPRESTAPNCEGGG